MGNSPEVVNYYIPLMKTLNMSWEELKNTPRYELEGLMIGLSEYTILHSFDGYTSKDVSEMKKNNSQISQQYADYMARQRKYNKSKKPKSFGELM